MTESNPCIFGPLLSPLHDGELPEDRRHEVLEHVRACTNCTAELADIRRFGGVLIATGPTLSDVPDDRLDQIFEQSRQIADDPSVDVHTRDATDAGPFPRPAGEPTHLRYVRWVSGAAAAVFVLAIGQVVYQQATQPDATTPDRQLKGAIYEGTTQPSPSSVGEPLPPQH